MTVTAETYGFTVSCATCSTPMAETRPSVRREPAGEACLMVDALLVCEVCDRPHRLIVNLLPDWRP